MLENLIASFGQGIVANPLIYFVIAFFLIAIFGDPPVVLLLVLYVDLNLPLWPIFLLAYISALAGDSMWFLVERKVFARIEKYKIFGRPYKHLHRFINKVAHRNNFITLLSSKFLYGTKIFTDIYLSKRKLSFLRFLCYNAISSLVWVIFVGAIGYGVGIGFSFLAKGVKSIEIAITALIIGFVIFSLIHKKITEKLENKK